MQPLVATPGAAEYIVSVPVNSQTVTPVTIDRARQVPHSGGYETENSLLQAMTRQATVREHLRAIVDRTTDGCTCAPDLNIRYCCTRHDFSYRNGLDPSNLSKINRREADERLRTCIDRRLRYSPVMRLWLPWVYWLFVRLFGRWVWQGER